MVYVFVVAACTAGKGIVKVASFVVKISVRPPPRIFCPPQNFLLYSTGFKVS